MIVRERDTAFVLIEQHHHAQLSAAIMRQWQDVFFRGDDKYASVMYAIENHDLGWRHFDEQPFWNDQNNQPYAFTNFPTLAKIVLYQHGIDEVEKHDAYAAILCSAHYARFMAHQEEAKAFILKEEARRKRLIAAVSSYDAAAFDRHFELLRFADNVSLYICLNEPGVEKEKEHPFFQKGIPLAQDVSQADTEMIPCTWQDSKTVVFQKLPDAAPFTITLKQKILPKQLIKQNGLLAAYEKTNDIEKQIQVKTI